MLMHIECTLCATGVYPHLQGNLSSVHHNNGTDWQAIGRLYGMFDYATRKGIAPHGNSPMSDSERKQVKDLQNARKR